jgi:hypothetical protein
MNRTNNYSELKLAAVRSGLRYWQIAEAANQHLPPELHLSENAVTRISTNRKAPSPEQAEALASVLSVPVSELFSDLGNNSSNVQKTEGGEA